VLGEEASGYDMYVAVGFVLLVCALDVVALDIDEADWVGGLLRCTLVCCPCNRALEMRPGWND
jgi:hypothetical protein